MKVNQVSKFAVTCLCLIIASCSGGGNSSSTNNTTIKNTLKANKSDVCDKEQYLLGVQNQSESLALSIEKGDTACVREFLTNIKNINEKISTNKVKPSEYPIFLALEMTTFTSEAQESIIKLIVENGADLSVKNRKGETLITYMISKHIFTTDSLLSDYILGLNKTLLNDVNVDGINPLHLAITNESNSLVKKLVDMGTNLEIADSNGDKPLFLALDKNMFKTMEYMIEKGANLNITKKNGKTLLMSLIEKQAQSKEDISEFILSVATKLPITNINNVEANESTALSYAIYYNFPKLTRALLNLGADININPSGRNLLSEIIRNNDFSLYNLAVKNVNKLNLQNSDGLTALMVATAIKNFDIVKDLITRGASAQKLNRYNQSALQMTSDADIQKVLLLAGAPINQVDNNEQTALLTALAQNNLSNIQLLLDFKANTEIFNSQKETAVFFAKSPEALKLLVASGANINNADINGATTLFRSIRAYIDENPTGDNDLNLNMIKVSLKLGANPNLHPAKESPILLSIITLNKVHFTQVGLIYEAFDYSSLIRLLIEAKADLNIRYPDGSTLLHAVHNLAEAKVILKTKPDITALDKEGKTALTVKEEEFAQATMISNYAKDRINNYKETIKDLENQLSKIDSKNPTREDLDNKWRSAQSGLEYSQNILDVCKNVMKELNSIISILKATN
jgi:ankyrin repeat protein